MLLVTGADGQLGMELRRHLGERALYAGRRELDITDEAAVKAYFAAHSIELVINCAAYTAVDKAEDDVEQAALVNRQGAALLARYGRNIVQISTDYVFDGNSSVPYTEYDTPNPLSVYGRTKLAGEEAVLEEAETAVVLRTAWLYSEFQKNFLTTMLRLGKTQKEVRVVNDQTGSPTAASELAYVLKVVIPQIKPGQKGIWHCACSGSASWYEFAQAIMDQFGMDCRVLPLSTAEYQARACRPAYSVLSSEKLRRDFEVSPSNWKDALHIISNTPRR